MHQVDLRKELKQLYQPSAKEVEQVDVPTFRFLMIDGQGDPNTSPEYAQAIEALFAVSYAAKFIVKKSTQAVDYAVMPLEGLWWADDMSDFITGAKSSWRWTMMIMQPSWATDDVLAAATDASAKKNLPALGKLRVEAFTEGRCAQVLHIGPFSAEGPTIQRLHKYIDALASRVGKHHEIYLSDIRRAAPQKWKTIIRQPMKNE